MSSVEFCKHIKFDNDRKDHTRDNKTGIQGQPGPQGPPGFNGTNGAQGPPGITFINNTISIRYRDRPTLQIVF